MFWTHNDSGDRPRIFGITREGTPIAEFSIEGAGAVDWEDIAIDDDGFLYLGDIGNNANRRRDLVVYRVPEPDPVDGQGSVRVERALRYRYADQQAYPDPESNTYDAEGLFWRGGSLYIFTKHRGDPYTRLYRLPVEAADTERALSPIATLDLGWQHERIGNATAADITPDGEHLALLTYKHLHLFAVAGSGDDLSLAPVKRIELDPEIVQQTESLAWDGSGGLLFGNEQRDLFHLAEPLAAERTHFPGPAPDTSRPD